MSKRKNTAVADCPCGGGQYASCCEPYHRGALPETAEKLMRARYSAFVKGEMEFVHRTWDDRTRPSLADLQRDRDDGGKWLGLEVRKHVAGQDQATVEFVARYKLDGRAQRLHEISSFVRQQGQWFYVKGIFPER
jgi:SEC-C motif-containing protein